MNTGNGITFGQESQPPKAMQPRFGGKRLKEIGVVKMMMRARNRPPIWLLLIAGGVTLLGILVYVQPSWFGLPSAPQVETSDPSRNPRMMP
jgi:hypothetical protein